MRRIFRTTTALAASIAIVAPQLALAQEQQPGTTIPEQLQMPPQEQPAEASQDTPPQAGQAAETEPLPESPPEPSAEAPSAEQAEQQRATASEQPPPAEQQEPQTQAGQSAESAPEAPQPAQDQGQAQTAEPSAKQQFMAEPAEMPTEKPDVIQAEQPQAKPPIVQADTPAPKPETTPEASDTSTGNVPEPAASPVPQADAAIDPDTLRKKLEADTINQGTGGQPQSDTEIPAMEQAQKPALKPQPAPQDDVKAAESSPQPDRQPDEIAAPEAQAKPNAVARRAAEEVAPVTAAALAADTDDTAKGEVTEEVITQDKARSSAEDFATAISQNLQPQQDTARSGAGSDDDDTTRDIAKMLLAGAAGLAVGKMLSNDRQVALNTGDRVVVTLPDGSQQVIKDENALLYRPGSNVQTETFQDGSTRSTVLREDGSRVVTIRDANMNILRRTLVRADGSETQLIDDTKAQPVRISELPPAPPVRPVRGPMGEDALRAALGREAAVDRRFSLGQVRDIPEVRALVAPVNVPEITFDTGSAAITPDQAQQLATLGKVIRDNVSQNPSEIYMIEGYTDAIGSNAANLALSDRRAESVALALTEYFQVPPENMVVQGYGEQFLLVPTQEAERENRRVAVRRITGLLAQRN